MRFTYSPDTRLPIYITNPSTGIITHGYIQHGLDYTGHQRGIITRIHAAVYWYFAVPAIELPMVFALTHDLVSRSCGNTELT